MSAPENKDCRGGSAYQVEVTQLSLNPKADVYAADCDLERCPYHASECRSSQSSRPSPTTPSPKEEATKYRRGLNIESHLLITSNFFFKLTL